MKTASTRSTMPQFSSGSPTDPDHAHPPENFANDATFTQIVQFIEQACHQALGKRPGSLGSVSHRMATEVMRICALSDRIQSSGEIDRWRQSLVQHRLSKCLHYYRLGSRQGRVELHSTLSAIAYRYIAPAGTHLGFDGRYALLEDFLQNFYIEVLNAFRREQNVPDTYTPRTRLELAEYMAFSEQYAKRRIHLRGRQSQQLLVLRAQAFARRMPAETAVDMALVADSPKSEDAEIHARSSALNQVREKMVAESPDLSDAVMRDRIIQTLIDYLAEQDQQDCIDYLSLKLKDCSASEIDDILGLSVRERDYLQQRFKYHVEKFAQVHHWELVHQWLGAEIDQHLGMTEEDWTAFVESLTPAQKKLVTFKQTQTADATLDDEAIAKALGWTPKKVQRTWGKVLGLAWKARNRL